MSLAIKGTFNACKDGEYYAMSYTCFGSEDDCATIQTLPDFTCEYKDGQLTCSNGVTCPGDSDFTTNVDIAFDNNEVSFEKKITSPGCSFTLSKAKEANSTVELQGGEECGKSRPDSESQSSGTPITNSSAACTASPCGPTAFTPETSSPTGTSTPPAVVVSSAVQFRLTKTMFLLTLVSVLLLFVPGSVATVVASPGEVLERDAIGSEFVARDTHNSASERSLEPRGLAEDILTWRGLYRPSVFNAEGLNLRKMYNLFRGIVIRDGEKVTGSAVDWILLGDDAWEDLVTTIQEVACQAMMSELESKTWQAKTIKPILDSATKKCIERAELRIIAALKDPKKYFKGFRSAPSIVIGTYVVCEGLVNLSWKFLKGALPPGTLPSWAKDTCTGNCYEHASARLTDPENCGTCGTKCESGACVHGACVVGACAKATGPDGTLRRCSSGDNYNTCACVNVETDVGMCVQYNSFSYQLITDSCDTSEDCDKGSVCAAFPGGYGGKACLEARSCLGPDAPPFQTEKIPPELAPGSPVEPGSQKVWRLRVSDEEYQVKWAENPVHLNSLGGDYLVKNLAGKMTVNTKCVPIRVSGEKNAAAGGSAGGIPDVTYLPKGRDVYFGYDSKDILDADPADSCCFKLWDSEDCSGNSWGGCGLWMDEVPFDVLGFQVGECEMLLPGEPDEDGRRRLSGHGGHPGDEDE